MTRFIIVFGFGALILFSCSRGKPKQSAESDNTITSTPVFPKENFPHDIVIRSVSFTTDTLQSFALYLPPSYSATEKFPVIIFFDPHGNGALPLTKYKGLAKQFGWVLIGSNNLKNGLTLSTTNRITASLIREIQSQMALDPKRISIAGFSGGAKVALSYAMDHPEITNVIYAGAATPLQHPNPGLSLLGFSGVNDMNYTELLAFDQSLSLTNMKHFLIEWNGKHEWPDSNIFMNAFYSIAFNDMRNNLLDIDEGMIVRFQKWNDDAIESNPSPLLKAMLLDKARYFLHSLSPVTSYNNQLSALEQRPEFQSAAKEKQQWVEQEQKLKQEYYTAFSEKNMAWWKQEIGKLNGSNDPGMKPMHQRLLGFISLAGYSIAGNAIRQNQFETANKMLNIYKLADPENSDQPFLEACYFAKLNEPEKAIASLNRAINLGLQDVSKIMNEPALSSLHSMPEFMALVKNMQQ